MNILATIQEIKEKDIKYRMGTLLVQLIDLQMKGLNGETMIGLNKSKIDEINKNLKNLWEISRDPTKHLDFYLNNSKYETKEKIEK